MCWSKRSPENEDSGLTTTRKPMESTVRCPTDSIECGDHVDRNHCSGHGQCCVHPSNSNNPFCKCHTGFHGFYCHERIPEFSKEMYERAQAIAAFSAVLGVIVITLFVVLVVLQIKYYYRRKKLRQKEGHHPPIVVTKKRLTIQPGYSWRESVRRSHSKVSQKFRSTLSRSVPEDLFQIGLKLAVLGGLKPKHGPIDQQSVAIKADVKAETTQPCFSAAPDLGDSSQTQTSFDLKDPASANDCPSVVQMPPTPTEDTVM